MISTRDFVFWGAAVALAVAVGYIDVRTEEVFIPALLLLGCGMTLGALRPRWGWLAGLILGLGVPAAHVIARATHFPVPYHTAITGTFLALIPGIVGGAAGGVMRTFLDVVRRGD